MQPFNQLFSEAICSHFSKIRSHFRNFNKFMIRKSTFPKPSKGEDQTGLPQGFNRKQEHSLSNKTKG